MRWNTPIYFLLLFISTAWMAFPQVHEPSIILPACAFILTAIWTVSLSVWLCREKISGHMGYQLVLWLVGICAGVILLIYDFSHFREGEAFLLQQPFYQYWLLLTVPAFSLNLWYWNRLCLSKAGR